VPQFFPFRGLLFNPNKVALQDVVAPPYDVINPEKQNELYERDEYNCVKIDFAREDNRYTISQERFQDWLKNEILLTDAAPAFYLLEQHFTVNFSSYTRFGIIGLCKLEELNVHSSIRRHERTYSKPKEDRLQLMNATNAQFSQVFSLFSDATFLTDEHCLALASTNPIADFEFENIHHRLWRMSDPNFHRQATEKFSLLELVIADGHHRYETALAYQELQKKDNPQHTGNEGYNYVLMYASNMLNSGVTILPTHRVVFSLPQPFAITLSTLEKYFRVKHYFSLKKLLEGMRRFKHLSFGVAIKDTPSLWLLQMKDERVLRELLKDVSADLQRLDVTVLHRLIFEQLLKIPLEQQQQRSVIDYENDGFTAYNTFLSGNTDAVFFMNSPTVDQVFNVGICGSTMPQKSTYFYPKLPTGTVFFDTQQF